MQGQLPKFTAFDKVQVPINHLPIFRSTIANQNRVERNLLFKTWGGLGDQICAEPTLRHALKMFTDCKISLHSEHPSLFSHLKFDNVFNAKKDKIDFEQYFVFETITQPDDSNLVWQFFSHMLTNCVDFPSLCALRMQLPTADKEIILKPKLGNKDLEQYKGGVFVHAGRHWPSKTFPKPWWDDVLLGLRENGITPILVGANTDDNRGTVDVMTGGCIDLRSKTSTDDVCWLMQNAKVLLTNDSAPLHMAASHNPDDVDAGNAWIGYVATCKHPDLITHWRAGEWNWREENLGLGGMWDIVSHNPNQEGEVLVDKVDPKVLASWLPKPERVVEWTLNKLT